jgi:broad specificity phosphatase PhoE
VPAILLARHGQASFGASEYDVLSGDGVVQAAALAAELSQRRLTVERVVSGALARQRDTAAPIAQAYGVEIEQDPRWDEYDMDDILRSHSDTPVRVNRAPGERRPQVSSREFQNVLEAAILDWIRAGDDGPARETWPVFRGRVTAALSDLASSATSGTTPIVVTSGGVIAAVCVELLSLPGESFVAFNRVAVNTGLTKLIHGRRGSTLVSFNEHGHLERGERSLVTYR